VPTGMAGKAACLAALITASCQAWAASELADALMRGHNDRVAELLGQGADVNGTQADGSTALHWAAYANDPQAVRLLIAAGAAPDARTRTGMTPLLLAAEAGSAEIVRQLLAAGAEVDGAFRNGETPLMMAARTGDTTTIDALVEAGADIEAAETIRGTTALMWAAAYANPAAVDRLVGHGANVAARSALIASGREPYLAPTARARINEYIRGTGLRGASVDFDTGDLDDDELAELAARLFDEEQARVDAEENPGPGDERVDTSLGREELIERARLRARLTQALSDGNAADAEAQATPAADPDANANANANVGDNDDSAGTDSPRPGRAADNGGLTALHFATREGDFDSVRILVENGADVNQTSEFGWTPLLTATQNRYYGIGLYLLDHGADPNIANHGGWNPLYIATDNRNIEGGDYPTRKPDLPHLDFIRRLLDAGADPNQRMASSTETRTIFTHQWLREAGATPFLRAAQSGDRELIDLLLEHGADPAIATEDGVTPLMVASGIAWVEGVTFEWSRQQTLEVMALLIELGADVNAQDTMDYRTALMGAAHKGHTEGVQLLVDHGADLALRDIGSRDSIHALAGVSWQALDYAEGLVRVGVQSAIAHPETAALIRKLMAERGLEVPPEGRTLDSICVVDLCR